AIDMDKGVIGPRAKARGKDVPGNLLFYEGEVISQNARAVTAFPQLKVKLRQIDELIGKNPNDPVGLTERGDLRLDRGDLNEAVEDLSLALRNKPPPDTAARARAKLYDTLTDFLQKDSDAAAEFIPDYAVLCKFDDSRSQ